MRTTTLGRRLCLISLLACLAPFRALSSEIDVGLLQGFGEARYHRLESKLLERGFHLFVRLPASYAAQEEAEFPVVYLLDGGVTFPLLAGYYTYLSLAEEVPDAILVGIGYGTDSFEEGNFRGTDFTAPSAEREHYGGAPRFQEMLRRELLPLIENEYRADPKRRVVFGQSLGGQFVLHAAQTEPGLFHGYIASNPALHRNLPFFLAPIATEPTSSRLYVASAEFDNERFRVPARQWMEVWSARAPKPWQLKVEVLPGHNHFSAAPDAFRQGMLWIFSQPQ